MKKETRYFETSPVIIPAHSQQKITVRPRFDHCRFQEGQTYLTRLIPVGGLPLQMGWPQDNPLAVTPSEGSLRIQGSFPIEGEYTLIIETPEGQPVAELHLYALEPDLFARRPFKGDTHMHTYHSDGKESPAYVAAACRRIGMDFMAITDHHRYFPSIEAIKAFEGAAADLHIFPGEEVHPPENRVHIVNFGGSFSINACFDKPTYLAEVQALAQSLDDLPAGLERYAFASCLWCFDKIREAGGLGILCHPYWIHRNRYDVPAALTDLLFERQPFDAYELIGGYFPHEAEANTLQVARYNEERSRGKRLPIVGASDSHGVETGQLYGWYYSVVFAPSPALPDLVSSVKQLYSAAVEAMPGEQPRAYGPLRLVRYALFLIREVFPQHDELCLEEGRLMLAHAAGESQAAPALADLQGQTARLYDHLWGK